MAKPRLNLKMQCSNLKSPQIEKYILSIHEIQFDINMYSIWMWNNKKKKKKIVHKKNLKIDH